MARRHTRPTRKMRPQVVEIVGDRFVACVLRVTEFDADGSPRAFRLLRDDETATLSRDDDQDNHFWIVYAPEKMPKRRD